MKSGEGRAVKLTEAQAREQAVLRSLDDVDGGEGGYLTFAGIQRRSGLDQRWIRRTTRRLCRKGLTEYGRGLWSDEGPAGAGYCITTAGRRALADASTTGGE